MACDNGLGRCGVWQARPDAELVSVIRVHCVRVRFVTGNRSLEGM